MGNFVRVLVAVVVYGREANGDKNAHKWKKSGAEAPLFNLIIFGFRE